MKTVIDVYVTSRKILGNTSRLHRELLAHPCITSCFATDLDQFKGTVKSIGSELIMGGLSTEEQSVLAYLEPFVLRGDIDVNLHDLSKFTNRFKARLQYKTTKTPFIVIGSQIIKGKISREALIEAISLYGEENISLENELLLGE